MTMMRLCIFSILLGWWAAPGVAMAQRPPQADEEHAVIFFFQRASFQGRLYDLYINDQLIVNNFPANSYFFTKVPAGDLLLRTSGKPKYFVDEKIFSMKTEAGRTYYVEAIADYQVFSVALYLVQRTESDFQSRLKKLQWHDKAKTTLD